MIGDGGVGAIAAAVGTMPCLERLKWVVHFPFTLNKANTAASTLMKLVRPEPDRLAAYEAILVLNF